MLWHTQREVLHNAYLHAACAIAQVVGQLHSDCLGMCLMTSIFLDHWWCRPKENNSDVMTRWEPRSSVGYKHCIQILALWELKRLCIAGIDISPSLAVVLRNGGLVCCTLVLFHVCVEVMCWCNALGFYLLNIPSLTRVFVFEHHNYTRNGPIMWHGWPNVHALIHVILGMVFTLNPLFYLCVLLTYRDTMKS
jgi:hypothetical protein